MVNCNVKKISEENIKLKTALSLRRLLESNKNYPHNENDVDIIVKSYGKISDEGDIRKATVSNILNAKSVAKSTTLILILEAMGFSLTDFAKTYYSISESDIVAFKKFLLSRE
ncbi:hypothetical protein B0A66_06110 [Flavobacterium hercynium]|uniref:HTH cro/C1-type domain-containing protein n=2 Tax=Flavobacterium TaxID=237 RepID=A0A226HHJ4_9FLAO|nr:hypothetical protein B0A66_06110 [Flavobacterium hercynium]